MKNAEIITSEVHDVLQISPLLSISENVSTSKVGKHFKKLLYLASLAGIGFFFNSCTAGFIVSEPLYVEVVRPPQPSNVHIWIEGDWVWSHRTHDYVRTNGHWVKPRHGRTYVSGTWQSTSKGKQWSPGRWEKQGHKRGHGRR